MLEVWTPNVITLWEALFTVLQYGLLLIHAYAQDKRWPYVSLPMRRDERPDDWVPAETPKYRKGDEDSHKYSEIHEGDKDRNMNIVDIFSIHSGNTGQYPEDKIPDKDDLLSIWKQQFLDAVTIESAKLRKLNSPYLRFTKVFWQLLIAPWRLLFAFVPPYQIAHGWIAFVFSLAFIAGVAYIVTKLTDLISCVTGINAYIIALTALAAGTSWPDLVASKIAAERQITADSAIANITCSNSVNIYVGIGVPWLINTSYNYFAYKEPLRIENAGGLSFSLLMFFATSVGCIVVLVFRRLTLGAELGGPRHWAWITSFYFMILWLTFVALSSLRVLGVI